MKRVFNCCFTNISSDPLEFSTNFSNTNSPRDTDMENKLKAIRNTLNQNYKNNRPFQTSTKVQQETKIIKDSIPLYKYSNCKLIDGGLSIEVVYTNP